MNVATPTGETTHGAGLDRQHGMRSGSPGSPRRPGRPRTRTSSRRASPRVKRNRLLGLAILAILALAVLAPAGLASVSEAQPEETTPRSAAAQHAGRPRRTRGPPAGARQAASRKQSPPQQAGRRRQGAPPKNRRAAHAIRRALPHGHKVDENAEVAIDCESITVRYFGFKSVEGSPNSVVQMIVMKRGRPACTSPSRPKPSRFEGTEATDVIPIAAPVGPIDRGPTLALEHERKQGRLRHPRIGEVRTETGVRDRKAPVARRPVHERTAHRQRRSDRALRDGRDEHGQHAADLQQLLRHGLRPRHDRRRAGDADRTARELHGRLRAHDHRRRRHGRLAGQHREDHGHARRRRRHLGRTRIERSRGDAETRRTEKKKKKKKKKPPKNRKAAPKTRPTTHNGTPTPKSGVLGTSGASSTSSSKSGVLGLRLGDRPLAARPAGLRAQQRHRQRQVRRASKASSSTSTVTACARWAPPPRAKACSRSASTSRR